MYNLKQNNINLTDFAKYSAIFMSINDKNFEIFKKFSSFGKIQKELFGEFFEDFINIQKAQNEIISYAHKLNSYEFFDCIKEAFDILENEKIISKSASLSLKTIFILQQKIINEKDENTYLHARSDLNFNQKINMLFNITNKLNNVIESEYLKKKLLHVEKNLQDKSFSIGITGVMNAGKSTFLNALMHSNLLGTAIIPETANLSIIKYSKQKKAKVNFWSKDEWSEIEKSAQSVDSIKKFVNETKEKFKNNLNEFIMPYSKQIEIDINELSNYTSAIKSNGICNLVKNVELYTDLPFLKDGVVIVDTPGLDDPVIQREVITKKYLANCDLMIHLMNASQSATLKDIEFIIDALTYQGISRLLIVLTRIDTISKEDLDEVKNYTKMSIKKQLEKYNKGALFSSILEKLEFICVSGKLALMHRTGEGEKALKLGYTEKQTGIFEIENYLTDVLFGENSPKANLLLNSNAKILYLSTNEALSSFNSERYNLGKSSDELKKELQNKKEQNAKKENDINTLLLHVKEMTNELESFAKSLLLEINQRVNSLKNKIQNLIFSDVKYELTKNNKKPTNERISYFIQTGIKDGILDIIRDYRFSFSKKSDDFQEKILDLFENKNIKNMQDNFDVKIFFQTHKNVINTNFTVLIEQILVAIKKSSKSSLHELSVNLEMLLVQNFEMLQKDLKSILESLNIELIETFESKNKEPLEYIKKMMNEEIKNINIQINLLDENVENVKQRVEILNHKIDELTEIKKSIKYFEMNSQSST